jgi:glycosyltransferase involved in cell wall biosynthesis
VTGSLREPSSPTEFFGKVLHVITSVNRGGAENHLVDLIDGQLQRGLRIEVAYLRGHGYWSRELEKKGVRVHPLGLRLYGDLRPLVRLRSVLADFEPDIVHAHMPPAELYARLAMWRDTRRCFIITKHNDERFCPLPGHRWFGSWVLRRARRVIAISDAVNRYVCYQLRAESRMVITIHYGVDTFRYQSPNHYFDLRMAWGCSAARLLVGTVSRLAPQKALHVLLEGYAHYRGFADLESRLVIVGVGNLENELKSLAGRLGIADQVIWTGFRDDIPNVMHAMDIFALTSNYEGFGLSLLEAMAAGRPIVATRVSAIPEIVRDGETGLLVEPQSPVAVARALKTLENPERRAELGRASRKRARECFSLEKMVGRTVALYGECLS